MWYFHNTKCIDIGRTEAWADSFIYIQWALGKMMIVTTAIVFSNKYQYNLVNHTITST